MSTVSNVKHEYEAVFIFSLKVDEAGVAALVERFKTLIEENAQLDKLDEWGKRRLAYPINYENDGFYVLYKFTSEADFPAELERVSNITENVIRSMCVRVEK